MRLRELRNQANKTQMEVAQYLGVSRQCYNNYELNNREPNKDTLLKLAEYFDVSVDYLLGKEDNPTLDEQLDGVEFALYGEIHDLTEEEKRDILSYVQFKKSQRGE